MCALPVKMQRIIAAGKLLFQFVPRHCRCQCFDVSIWFAAGNRYFQSRHCFSIGYHGSSNARGTSISTPPKFIDNFYKPVKIKSREIVDLKPHHWLTTCLAISPPPAGPVNSGAFIWVFFVVTANGIGGVDLKAYRHRCKSGIGTINPWTEIIDISWFLGSILTTIIESVSSPPSWLRRRNPAVKLNRG